MNMVGGKKKKRIHKPNKLKKRKKKKATPHKNNQPKQNTHTHKKPDCVKSIKQEIQLDL